MAARPATAAGTLMQQPRPATARLAALAARPATVRPRVLLPAPAVEHGARSSQAAELA